MEQLNQTGKLWEFERDYWMSVKGHLESGVPFNSLFQQGHLRALFPTGELPQRLYILHKVADTFEGGCEMIESLNELNINQKQIREMFPVANKIFDHPTVKQNHPTEFLLALSYLTLSQLYSDGWEDFAKKIIIGDLKKYCNIN